MPPFDNRDLTMPSGLTAPVSDIQPISAVPAISAAAVTAPAVAGDRSQARLAMMALLGITAVWGSTFVVFKGSLTRMPAADFLAIRFWLAAAALVLVSPRAALRITPAQWRIGLPLGLAYGGGQVLQALGLEHTTAAVAGFLTGAYVVLTPLFTALFLRRRVPGAAWFAVTMATAGMALISLHGFGIGTGEALTLASTVLFALHILGLGAWSKPGEAYQLAITQMVWTAMACTAVALAGGGLSLPTRASDWAVLIYMALFGAALAIVVQTWAQAHLAPTRAAVVMTTEPVWAGVFAVTLGGESLTWRLIVGGAVVLAAMYVAEVRSSS